MESNTRMRCLWMISKMRLNDTRQLYKNNSFNLIAPIGLGAFYFPITIFIWHAIIIDTAKIVVVITLVAVYVQTVKNENIPTSMDGNLFPHLQIHIWPLSISEKTNFSQPTFSKKIAPIITTDSD